MIAETRHQMILDILHKQRSASVQELAEQLHISESDRKSTRLNSSHP